MSEERPFGWMLEELAGMEHAVTSTEATFLQSMADLTSAGIVPTQTEIDAVKAVYDKYVKVERFHPDAEIDL